MVNWFEIIDIETSSEIIILQIISCFCETIFTALLKTVILLFHYKLEVFLVRNLNNFFIVGKKLWKAGIQGVTDIDASVRTFIIAPITEIFYPFLSWEGQMPVGSKNETYFTHLYSLSVRVGIFVHRLSKTSCNRLATRRIVPHTT